MSLQLVGAAPTPLKATVLVPCEAPKEVPVIATEVPTAPQTGLKALIAGPAPVTVNSMPLLACPPTVTTTGPVVAPAGTGTSIRFPLQLVGVPSTPLKVTVDVPCEDWKLFPRRFTTVPTGPESGFIFLISGADEAEASSSPLSFSLRVNVPEAACAWLATAASTGGSWVTVKAQPLLS